jgi:formyl-CoA transferase|tara:strand:+ start:163 stop:1356 length:1194 start_codon:yes stop_codon:yes gene_type:complete
MSKPLAGVRVIEIGQEIQGPFGALILSDLGADVIKIENREAGDLSRGALAGRSGGEDVDNADVSPYFLAMNRGKRSITLDLKLPDAVEIVNRLVATADVILTNYRPGVLDRLGLGFEALKAANPRIVFAQGSSWGPEGPWVARPSRDALAQAASGVMAKGGFEGGLPLPAPFAIADTSGGLSLATGILSGLFARERTGEAQRVDVSIYGTMLAMQGWEINFTALTGQEPLRAGRGHQFIRGIWGAFPTADGHIAIAGMDEQRWPKFCIILGLEDIMESEDRPTDGETIRALLDSVLPKRTSAAWLEELQAADILATEVVDYRTVLANEQARANGYVRPMDHPIAGEIFVSGSPISLNGEIPDRAEPPPEHGQHTEEILVEIGYEWEEISKLREDGAI